MTPPDLAGIIERDRESVTWADFDAEVPQRVSDAVWQAAADRRALLGLLRETRDAAKEYLAHDGSGLRLDADNPWRGDWDAVKNYDNLRALRTALAALVEP